MDWLLGRLSLEAIPTDLMTQGAAAGMVLAVLAAAGALTYFKKWRWLWENWITTVDAKKIGIMYVIVAVIMLIRGVADALMIRVQQVVGGSGEPGGFMDSDMFQQVFTAHGSIMIFFVAMGLMFGLINMVLPLMLGARDVAFPFLNNVSFWMFAAGMIMINFALVIGGFSIGGWLGYPPLTETAFTPGAGVDYWLWSLQISGIGSLLSGINFIVTIVRKRAKGMTLMKMPIFAWSVLAMSILLIFAFPILTGTLGMLTLDRLMDMRFFTSDYGGNPMMYINLIWAWGHPEVYILILPAFGIFSEIVATYSRKRLFGYKTMVAALFGISLLSFTVWLHHFFTMGAGSNVNGFFGITTMIIAIPTGVKIFNWLFTMFRGRVRFDSPMYWFFAFVLTFTIGGVTGVLLAVPAIDFQVHNSLFLVAHFHNVIIGGVVFGYFAGLTYWFPKVFGFKLHDGLGKASAILWSLGFIVAFMPLYALGFMGATRRLDYYDPSTGWQKLFIVAGVGVVIIGAAIFVQLLQLGVSLWKRQQYRVTSHDPWNGRTLEWSVPSPAPHYNFAVDPVYDEIDAYWYQKETGKQPGPLKSVSDYHPVELPKNSGLGFAMAVTAFILSFGLIWHMWWLALLSLVVLIALIIKRTSDDEFEYTISPAQMRKHDVAEWRKMKGSSA